MKFLFKRKKIFLVWTIVFIIVATSGYFNYQYFKLSKDLKKPNTDVSKIIEKVSKLMILPKNETPTVATVSDPEALKSQKFFYNAAKDDKVIIYSNAEKAILYRPSENKIVEIAPINKGSNDSTSLSN